MNDDRKREEGWQVCEGRGLNICVLREIKQKVEEKKDLEVTGDWFQRWMRDSGKGGVMIVMKDKWWENMK